MVVQPIAGPMTHAFTLCAHDNGEREPPVAMQSVLFGLAQAASAVARSMASTTWRTWNGFLRKPSKPAARSDWA